MCHPFPCDRQLDMMDCGPACLKMIARHYGKYYSLQYFRDRCGISREGESFLDLGHAAEQIGLRSLSIKCTMDDLIHKVPLPVIVPNKLGTIATLSLSIKPVPVVCMCPIRLKAG